MVGIFSGSSRSEDKVVNDKGRKFTSFVKL
jgi:hypothetical protein